MAKSVIQSDKSRCYICGRNGNSDALEEHHVYFGTANRKKSDDYGLTVYLCGDRCHRCGRESVHRNITVCRELQAKVQEIAMQYYGWTVEDFISIFGRNYT